MPDIEIEEKEMLENVEHCIRNFNGRIVDCIAVGNIHKKYIELREELEMWQKIAKRLELALENDGLDLDIEWAREEVLKDESRTNRN